jgi:cation diffusion facilitator family transporter
MFNHGETPQDHHPHPHRHTHGAVDPSIATTARGMWAIKWSFLGLLVTALLQMVVVWLSGSVALLADTIHNVTDAGTALPLWVAFTLARWPPSRCFPYGYGRVEDLAGVAIVLTIVLSALWAGYESITRLLHPHPVQHLWAVTAAAILGFLGNEAVAVFRIKVGREIGSAALVADGYHARVDGLTSVAVLGSAVGVWAGYPVIDPLIGLLITGVILIIVWQSGKIVLTRLLDGVDPEVIDTITHAAGHTPGVQQVSEVRARWIGHRLHAEVNVTVATALSVQEGHTIATAVRHQLFDEVPYLSQAMIHVDPTNASGEAFHRLVDPAHVESVPQGHA